MWDTYITDSIKASTREKQGQGIRLNVAGKNKVPKTFCVIKNKEQLFKLLTIKIISLKYSDNKEVFVTDGPLVLTNGTTQPMSQHNHEEAYIRLVVHIADAMKKGLSTSLVHTVDTDVIVILIGTFSHFIAVNSDKNIWVAFAVGKNFAF